MILPSISWFIICIYKFYFNNTPLNCKEDGSLRYVWDEIECFYEIFILFCYGNFLGFAQIYVAMVIDDNQIWV